MAEDERPELDRDDEEAPVPDEGAEAVEEEHAEAVEEQETESQLRREDEMRHEEARRETAADNAPDEMPNDDRT